MKLNYKEVAVGALKEITMQVEVDHQKLDVAAFGKYRWRFKLAMMMFWIGTHILRVNIKVNEHNEP